jgi:hypothetical protein
MARDKTDANPAATGALNEWGIPDWRDAEAYGEVVQWTFNRWRWEFYRRRDDLRAFFDRWADDPEVRNFACNKGLSPNQPGFLALGNGDEKGVAIRRFGYGGVPNPRIGDQPAIRIMPSDQFFHKFRFYNPAKRQPQTLSVREALGEKRPRTYELTLWDHEYAIKFDLNKPLNHQAQEALEILKNAQIKLHGKLVHRKKLETKWLAYLRVLDARAANPDASWQALTDALAGVRLVDRYKNESGGYRAPPPQAGRDRWVAADALRFNF